MRTISGRFTASTVGPLLVFMQLFSTCPAAEGRTGLTENVLRYYAQTFPDIHFLHLHARDRWALNALPIFMGEHASNRDYAHDGKSRELLLEAQLYRIGQMLGAGAPSATLFATGTGALVEQPYLCVLTLEDNRLLEDPLAATSIMLSAEQNEYLARVASTARLDGTHFLRFTLDHEIYHCLDAYMNGPPRPKTTSQLTADYHDYLVEYNADVFATLRALQYPRNSRAFLEKMKTYRHFSLSDFDVSHLTASAIQSALTVPPVKVRGLSLSELAQLANKHALRNRPSRDKFSSMYAAALHIATTTGSLRGNRFSQTEMPNLPGAEAQQVANMAVSLLRAQREIFRGKAAKKNNGEHTINH